MWMKNAFHTFHMSISFSPKPEHIKIYYKKIFNDTSSSIYFSRYFWKLIWFLFVSNLFTISDLFNLHFMDVTIWICMRKCWLFYWQFQNHRMNSQIFKLIKFWFCWLSFIDLDWWLIDMSTNANYICNQLETPWDQTKKQLNFTEVTWESSQSLSLVRYGCSCNLYNCFWNDKNQKHSYWIDGYVHRGISLKV